MQRQTAKTLNLISHQIFRLYGRKNFTNLIYGANVIRSISVCYVCRFGSRELIGGVAVQLEHADLFGLTVHSRIEPQSSGLEVRDDYSSH